MARTKGAVSTHDNEAVQNYLLQYKDIYDLDSYTHSINNVIDDCLRGATGQMAGTQRPSAYRVFTLLRLLPTISTLTVAEVMNRKQMAITGKGYSKSYIEYWTKTLRCASQAIAHHVDLTIRETGETQEQSPAVVYTEDQKDIIRMLAIKGDLHSLTEYVKSLHI